MRDNSHGCFTLLKKFLKSYYLGRATLLMARMSQAQRDAVQMLMDFRNITVASDNYPFEKDSDDTEGSI
jgi:hypothetical protein